MCHIAAYFPRSKQNIRGRKLYIGAISHSYNHEVSHAVWTVAALKRLFQIATTIMTVGLRLDMQSYC